MRIVVDENLPPRLAEILRLLGHEAQHVAWLDLGGAKDVDWIPAARDHADIVLSTDVRISRREAEVEALKRSRMHLFVFPSQEQLDGWLLLFLRRQHDIQRCSDARGPCRRRQRVAIRTDGVGAQRHRIRQTAPGPAARRRSEARAGEAHGDAGIERSRLAFTLPRPLDAQARHGALRRPSCAPP